MASAVIYTALFGDHGPLPELADARPDTHVCFTDNPAALKTSAWHIVPCRARFADPRMSAKWYRMSSDYLFPDHDISIWVDVSMTPNTEALIAAAGSALAGDKGLALFVHPERNNIYEEMAVSAQMGKYNGEPMFEQVTAYRNEGLPPTHGLWATGIIARAKGVPWMPALNRLWLNENIRWSCQDQLSLPYVLWKLGVTPGVLPGSIYDTPLATRVWTGPDK